MIRRSTLNDLWAFVVAIGFGLAMAVLTVLVAGSSVLALLVAPLAMVLCVNVVQAL